MLAVPTPSGSRFTRSLYDVDRSKPSPFAWKPCAKKPRSYVRRMGLVETFFNTMATLHEGRTDIFYRIPLSCSAAAYDQLVRRLPLAWALLCRRHPLLGAYVETLTPDGTPLDPQEAVSRRHEGEATADASSSSEPHFLFNLPDSASTLLDYASQRVVVIPDTWRPDLQVGLSSSRRDAVVAWLDRYVWNGKRRFLHQHTAYGLARLLLLPPSPSIGNTNEASFDLIFCTAHCISDGLSVSSLAAELLHLLASPQLPLELPALEHQAEMTSEVPGATVARYTSVTWDMKQALLSGLLHPSLSDGPAKGDDSMDLRHFAPLLPPAIEATYPELLPMRAATAADTLPLPCSKLARARWFWSVRRVICQLRADKAEQEVLSDFKATRTGNTIKEPWWGAQTCWSVVRLSPQDTSALTQLAKRKKVRVGSLLYAVAACALNTLEKAHTPPGSRIQETTTTIIGFPFSTRKYLEARTPLDILQSADVQDPLLPPSSLGVKLGFNGVALPPAELFSLPSMPSSDSLGLTPFLVAQLWQNARQVQKQFNGIFAEPRFMLADGFLTALEREMRFRNHGVKDVFQAFKADEEEQQQESAVVAGEDERRPGVTKKNMQGPGSSLNFSMVGLLDSIVPSALDLPFVAANNTEATLQVGEDLMFGVRTRAGEAFGTSFTFRGQLNLELGHDAVVWDTDKVHEYLGLMKHIVEAIVAFERSS